jgi:ATP-dependent helicase/DNAse subunit B
MEENILLLSLIKDHLVYSRLLNGLSTAGVEVESFYLKLSDTIFSLAALNDDEDETRYDYYLTMVERISFFDASQWSKEIEPIAKEIHETISNWQEEDLRLVLPYVEYV